MPDFPDNLCYRSTQCFSDLPLKQKILQTPRLMNGGWWLHHTPPPPHPFLPSPVTLRLLGLIGSWWDSVCRLDDCAVDDYWESRCARLGLVCPHGLGESRCCVVGKILSLHAGQHLIPCPGLIIERLSQSFFFFFFIRPGFWEVDHSLFRVPVCWSPWWGAHFFFTRIRGDAQRSSCRHGDTCTVGGSRPALSVDCFAPESLIDMDAHPVLCFRTPVCELFDPDTI